MGLSPSPVRLDIDGLPCELYEDIRRDDEDVVVLEARRSKGAEGRREAGVLGGKLTCPRSGEVGWEDAGVACREAVRLGDALFWP